MPSETTNDDEGPVYRLPPSTTFEQIDPDGRYLATVNGVVEYGIFVDLSESISGLVHESLLDDSPDTYAVGDELVVGIEQVRDNGDIAFQPIDADPDAAESFEPEIEPTPVEEIVARTEDVHLEGVLVQIKQTGGPTILKLQDGTGIMNCSAFEAAGVRAYPDLEIGDLVRVTGSVETHNGSPQVEVADIERIEGDAASELRATLSATIDEKAAAHEVEPLIEWDALEPMLEELREVATMIRRMVLEGRPIRIRHHADTDGMCAAIPVTLAITRYINEIHAEAEADRHLVKRLPSKAPFYEMEDATRDLNFALEDQSRHGHQLPMLLMLDNGSTEEDVPAYETLAHYDIPIVAIDHHHPDPAAVDRLLEAHVNPYLHDEDYRITTGMLCVELARMIAPDLSKSLGHVPAVAGLADRSDADAMADYLELAERAGYDEDRLRDVTDALDYAAHWLRYRAGTPLIADVLNVGAPDHSRHRELVAFLADRARADIGTQLDAALPHLDRERLSNGALLCRIDVEGAAHRFTYPAPGTTTGEVHDHVVEETGDPVITIGHGPDFAVLRSDGVRLDIPRMVDELTAELPGAGVSGGGHLVVGSIKFVKGMREEVLDALIEKMADAPLDEDLRSTGTALDVSEV